MALDKTTLEKSIETAFNNQSDKKVDPAEARKAIAKDLANAFNVFVKSGTVNTTVSTTGTAAAQTGTGTGSIS